MKLLLMNGPNLNLLGQREPDVYGTTTLADIEADTVAYAHEHGADMDCFQSNHEGELIDEIHASQGVYDGIVYNPGAHTHYSYALHDAISSVTTAGRRGAHLGYLEARGVSPALGARRRMHRANQGARAGRLSARRRHALGAPFLMVHTRGGVLSIGLRS